MSFLVYIRCYFNKKKININCYILENGYLIFKKLEDCLWITLVFFWKIINFKCKNIIIICYYLFIIFLFSFYRGFMRWLLLLFIFYYEKSIKRDLKKF